MLKRDLICYTFASKWYQRILEMFHFDQQQDIKSRDLLFQFRSKFDPTSLIQNIRQNLISKKLFFFGTGPNLVTELYTLLPKIQKNRTHFYLTAADGASRALRDCQLVPDLIISDLDGLSMKDLDQFCNCGVPMAIHAHGDNQIRLKDASGLLSTYEKIIGTTQVEARWPILNPGGFTDGDRGLYLLHWLAFRTKEFTLVGYDFGDNIGRYSKPDFTQDMPMTPIKKQKLMLSRDLIQNLRENEKRKITYFKYT